MCRLESAGFSLSELAWADAISHHNFDCTSMFRGSHFRLFRFFHIAAAALQLQRWTEAAELFGMVFNRHECTNPDDYTSLKTCRLWYSVLHKYPDVRSTLSVIGVPSLLKSDAADSKSAGLKKASKVQSSWSTAMQLRLHTGQTNATSRSALMDRQGVLTYHDI